MSEIFGFQCLVFALFVQGELLLSKEAKGEFYNQIEQDITKQIDKLKVNSDFSNCSQDQVEEKLIFPKI